MNRIKWMKRALSGGLCLILLILCSTPCFAAKEDAPILKVAFCPLDGFFEYDINGGETGYGVDLLNKISEYTGIAFEYVPADTWEQTKEMLLSGEADIRMPGTLPKTPSTTLEYTSESVMDTYRAVMTLKSREDLYYKDYDHFSNLIFGMVTAIVFGKMKNVRRKTRCCRLWLTSAKKRTSATASSSRVPESLCMITARTPIR